MDYLDTFLKHISNVLVFFVFFVISIRSLYYLWRIVMGVNKSPNYMRDSLKSTTGTQRCHSKPSGDPPNFKAFFIKILNLFYGDKKPIDKK